MNSGSQPFLPEDRSIEAQRHWLRFAEVYQLPHVQIFNSLEHLEEILLTADFHDLHAQMSAFNRQKRNRVYSQIHELAARIPTRGSVPTKYSDAA